MAGFLKSSDERVDSIEPANRMPALAKQGKAVEEFLGSLRYNLDVGFELSRIVDELGEAVITDMKPEILGRDVFKVVGFIENHSTVVRKDRRNIGLANRQIGKKQMVIHHNNVGFHRLLPHEREKASIIVFAFRAQTSVAARIHARPL